MKTWNVFAVAVGSAVLSFAPASARGAPPQVESSRAAAELELAERCFTSLGELATRAPGVRRAFRYRRVDRDPASAGNDVERVLDGVVRIAFRRAGLLVEEVRSDASNEMGFLPVPRRVITWYSFASGEYARFQDQAGSGGGTVILEHFKTLPVVASYALGSFGVKSVLREAVEPSCEISASEGTRVRFRSPLGTAITLEWQDAGARGSARRFEESFPGSLRSERVAFFASSGDARDPQFRPALVVESHTDERGVVYQSEAWQAIDGAWAEGEPRTELVPGTTIIDLRAAGGRRVDGTPLERPTLLEDALAWPGAEHSLAGTVVYTPPRDVRAASSSWPVARGALGALSIAGCIVMGAWLSSLRRGRRS